MNRTNYHSLIFGIAKSIGIAYLLFVLFSNGFVFQGLFFLALVVVPLSIIFIVERVRARRQRFDSKNPAPSGKRERAQKMAEQFAEKMGATFAVIMTPAIFMMFLFDGNTPIVVASWAAAFIVIIVVAIYAGKRQRQRMTMILAEPSEGISKNSDGGNFHADLGIS